MLCVIAVDVVQVTRREDSGTGEYEGRGRGRGGGARESRSSSAASHADWSSSL